MAPMGMNPMATGQGMFGGYDMSMSGMSDEMNMGMNFNSQGMYGSWNGNENNMWSGVPDKFNANAFANRMGADYGPSPGYRGFNQSQTHGNFPNMQQQQQQYFNNDFHVPFNHSYGRGRGRGRGFMYNNRGRGGFASTMQGSYPPTNLGPNQHHSTSQLPYQNENVAEVPNTVSNAPTNADNIKKFNDELAPGGEDDTRELESKSQSKEQDDSVQQINEHHDINKPNGTTENGFSSIPVIDQIPNSDAAQVSRMVSHGMSDSRSYDGGRLPDGMAPPASTLPTAQVSAVPTEPKGLGVAGAPAAPRAMRQGLPNTSIRNRGFAIVGRASMPGQNVDKESRDPQQPHLRMYVSPN